MKEAGFLAKIGRTRDLPARRPPPGTIAVRPASRDRACRQRLEHQAA